MPPILPSLCTPLGGVGGTICMYSTTTSARTVRSKRWRDLPTCAISALGEHRDLHACEHNCDNYCRDMRCRPHDIHNS